MQGDTAKAKAAYQDFFTLWKGADPDLPILKQAKTEYTKLRYATDVISSGVVKTDSLAVTFSRFAEWMLYAAEPYAEAAGSP
jgi:hypothetical protein